MAPEFFQVIIFQMKRLQPDQSGESVVAERSDVAVVQEQMPDPVAAKEVLLVDVAKVVAIQMNVGGVHGNEKRNIGVVFGGAGNYVLRPGSIM